MKSTLQPIITVSELQQLLQEENLLIIDAGSGDSAKERYKNEHIAGAFYVDLNDDLAEITEGAASGGRHPLPAPDKFAKVLGSLGISPESRVVVYDDKQGSNAAARFWWMLRAAGHEKVHVLNGVLQSAKAAGITMTRETIAPEKVSPYPIEDWQLPLKTITQVKQASTDDNYLIIDVRDNERYLGLTEPLDPIAGHIPNAINLPFKNHLDNNGEFLNADELHKLYEPVLDKFDFNNIIVHCGQELQPATHYLLWHRRVLQSRHFMWVRGANGAAIINKANEI